MNNFVFEENEIGGVKKGSSIGFEVRSLMILMKRAIRKYYQEPMENATELHGFIVEYLLKHQNKDTYQRDLEEILTIRRSTASKMLKLMEKNHIIQRIAVGQDARLKKIVLTDKAKEFNITIHEIVAKMDEKIMNDILEEDINVFFKVIDQMKHNLKE